MFDVDVHILTRPTTNKRWLSECISSLQDEPVNLYVTQGVEGNIGIGKGRYKAFQLGQAPFVSFVDDDDRVRAGVFSKIATHLESNRVVYTDEILMDQDGNFLKHGWSSHPEEWVSVMPLIVDLLGGTPVCHHLVVMPREAVISNLDSLLLDTALRNESTQATGSQLRVYASANHRIRVPDPRPGYCVQTIGFTVWGKNLLTTKGELK